MKLASVGTVVTEKKKFKNIESERFGPKTSMNDLYLWYSSIVLPSSHIKAYGTKFDLAIK